MHPPDYEGAGLTSLMAELEGRLDGSPPMPALTPELAELIPEAASYILVLFDGLGSYQLVHPEAGSLAESCRASIDVPFPTTTTVSLASIATGEPPSRHGLIAYQMWLPEAELVAGTIKWATLWGDPVDVDFDRFLPAPNLWERLRDAGREPITVQPGHFAGSPLSRVLYRGCRFEPVFTVEEIVAAAVELAATPGRLVFVYVPQVDFAAHVFGQDSEGYAEAMRIAAGVWEGIAHRLPTNATLIGTADHGHVDFPEERRIRLPREREQGLILYGDSRVMFVKGETGASLAEGLPATWIPIEDMIDWWGPGPLHPAFGERAPDGVLVADAGYALLHRHSDDRLIGNHGGLTDEERQVPLMVWPHPRLHPV